MALDHVVHEHKFKSSYFHLLKAKIILPISKRVQRIGKRILYATSQCTYKSGCTISSGLYDFITTAASLVQNT